MTARRPASSPARGGPTGTLTRMGITDRLRRRTPTAAGVTLAAPRPQAGAVDTDVDTGRLGGPMTGGYVRQNTAGGPTGTLLRSSKLGPDVVNAMREDPQVSSCLVVQSLPALRAEWTVECEDDDIRETVTAWWEHIRPELVRSFIRALWAGYSPNVLVWDIDPDTSGLYVRKIRDLDPYTCKPRTNDAGDYVGMVQNEHHPEEVEWVGDGPDGVVLTLWLVEGMESGNLYGRSILTPARQAWQDKLALNLFHMRGLERFAFPVTRVRAPEGSYVANAAEIQAAELGGLTPPDPVFRRKLDDALVMGESLANGSVVAVPSERAMTAEAKDAGYAWDVDYLETTHGAADIRAAIEDKNADIALGLLVPSLLLEGGDTVGSNALGQSHRDTFTQNAEARLSDWAGQITRHLFSRFVDLNYGERAPRATLVPAPLADEDRGRLWDIAVALITAGKLAPDVEDIAGRIGLPVAEVQPDAEEDIEVEAERLAARLDAAELHDEAAYLRSAVLARPADVTGVPEWKLPQQYDTTSGFRRELTARENGASLRRLESGMNTAEAETLDRLEELLEGSRERVLRQVAAIIRKGGPVADIIDALGGVEVTTAAGTSPFAAAWLDLQRRMWDLGLDSIRAELAQYADKVPGRMGRDGTAIAKGWAQIAADTVTGRLAAAVRTELIGQYRSGVSAAGLAAAVSDLYDREVSREAQSTRLTTRMLAARAVNEGRRDAIERGGIPLRGAQYSALLDKRTCALCERLDEQVLAIGDLDYVKFTAPVHHNCRCVWVFITSEEADFTPTWESPPRSLVEAHGSLVVG